MTPPPQRPEFPALRLVPTSRFARRLGGLLLLTFLATPFVLLFVPWQQSCTASGRVIAFNPIERQQVVEAPVDGRVAQLYVREGSRVQAGTLLVALQDPNPNLMSLLETQKDAVRARKQAAQDRRDTFDKQTKALLASKAAAEKAGQERFSMARDRYEAARQGVEVARLTRDVAAENFKMEDRLRPEGLNSRLVWLQARQQMEARQAEWERSGATREAALKEIEALRSDLDKIRNDADAAILVATANWQAALSELASADRDLAEIEVRLGRQATQNVTAPCAGTVFRVLANGASGGTLVKSGDPLVAIVPDIPDDADRVVELFMDGNDAPLVTELWRTRVRERAVEEAARRGFDPTDERFGPIFQELLHREHQTTIPVRLQFEGWPAVQWVGWPSVAVGTFGGVVAFVDPHDDGKGRFRILVRPDPVEGMTNPWPSGFSLRQGLRAQGWVQLNRVTLGWELWRRINAFPPIVAPKDPDKDTKPVKVKVPK